MVRALQSADRRGAGFLTPQEIRAVLTDPSHRNHAASSTAAGWPMVDGDYRRLGSAGPDYRHLYATTLPLFLSCVSV